MSKTVARSRASSQAARRSQCDAWQWILGKKGLLSRQSESQHSRLTRRNHHFSELEVKIIDLDDTEKIIFLEKQHERGVRKVTWHPKLDLVVRGLPSLHVRV